jgi:hypothetical protein
MVRVWIEGRLEKWIRGFFLPSDNTFITYVSYNVRALLWWQHFFVRFFHIF